jgi:signal transduction histidine kinase/CheY-like chemotaxis protein
MPSPGEPPADAASIFPGGGVAGEALRGTDWSRTALGPIAGWPISLRTLVRTMLATRQAMCLFWGPALVNLYNEGFIALLGEKHPAAMGQRAEECWSDAWPVVGGLLNDVVSHGSAVLFQEMLVPIVRKGRLEDAWWNYSYSPAFDDAGAVAGVLVVATETTGEVAGRKQLEAARVSGELARTELHAVFMQSPLPMAFLKGPEHRFTLVNGPYAALVTRDVVGRTLGEAFTDEEAGYYRGILDRVYRTGEPAVLHEALLRLPDAAGVVRDRYIDVGYDAFRDADGAVTGIIAVIHDVTFQAAARARESLLRKEAEAANLAKDEFLATVSHELRTPLNAILGWARLLAETRDAERWDKGLTVIRRNSEAQARLIDDILDVSRIISGKVVIDLKRVHLASVIENAVESIRPATLAKRIELEVHLEDAAFDIVADESRLQQIVWNLLSNAVKFTPVAGRVRVAAIRDASRVSIRVNDTGKGISPEFLPHVFDRFRQGESTTTKRYGGLGLGLAIVRHLVELHGGSVTAHSEGDGLGATFEIVLPIRAVHTPEPAPVGPLAPNEMEVGDAAVSRRDTSLEGIRILVVDDEEDARDLIATVFQQAGARVAQAASAAEALGILASGSTGSAGAGAAFDIVVSDIGMPNEDGYSLVRRMRKDAALAAIPAIALTAYAAADDRRRVFAAGFQHHATKPVDAGLLARTVVGLVRGA